MGLPPDFKRINGKKYTLTGRYETRPQAQDRAKFLKNIYPKNTSVRMIKLPESQWGAVWMIRKYALYINYGRTEQGKERGLADLFG